MVRRRRTAPSKFDAVPESWRPKLSRIAVAAGAVTFLVVVVLLGATSYRTGFAPQAQVYRTGEVTVTACERQPSQLWLVHECLATVDRWNPDVVPGLELTSAPQVRLISRVDVAGRKVAVASHQAVLGRTSGADQTLVEVILPTDQRPLPDGLKLLLALACLATPFLGTLLWGRLAWEIALKISRRRPQG
jgi:hypothetical protein